MLVIELEDGHAVPYVYGTAVRPVAPEKRRRKAKPVYVRIAVMACKRL